VLSSGSHRIYEHDTDTLMHGDRRPQYVVAGHGDIFSARENEKKACCLTSNVVHREYAYGRVRADVLPYVCSETVLPHGIKNSNHLEPIEEWI
jgi:hypothetical protein